MINISIDGKAITNEKFNFVVCLAVNKRLMYNSAYFRLLAEIPNEFNSKLDCAFCNNNKMSNSMC